MNVALVLGARPQIIKSAPILRVANSDPHLQMSVIHTGQHYDYEMTQVFFEELDLPDPLVNLNVGSGTHAQQTARIMIRLERVLNTHRPDLVLVPGDTNSTLASALTAAKLNIPVAHVEAGARSYDRTMPEEVNRCLTDHCSAILFTPTEICTKNLLTEGINRKTIYQAGDTMYDVLLQQLPYADRTNILDRLTLTPKTYAVLTAHRPENVDNPTNLTNIIDAMIHISPLPIVFPTHPRTLKQLQKLNLYPEIHKHPHIRLISPTSYHETLNLIQHAKILLTDSGGMQKEAFWLKTPCITLRHTTEWLETVHLKANYLISPNTQNIIQTVKAILEKEAQLKVNLQTLPNPFGDGHAAEKIVKAISAFG